MDSLVLYQLCKKPVAKYKISIYLEDCTQNSSLKFCFSHLREKENLKIILGDSYLGILQKIPHLNSKRIFSITFLKKNKSKCPLLLHAAVRFFTGETLTVKETSLNNPKKYKQISKVPYIK